MKGERIVRRTTADRKKGRTDWQRLGNMSDAEARRAAESDSDNPPWSEEHLRNARLVLPSSTGKVPLSIRLDREVIDYFKDRGPGYQSRMGAVLLSYVRSQEHAGAARAQRAPVRKRTSTKKSRTTTAKAAAKGKKKTGTTR